VAVVAVTAALAAAGCGSSGSGGGGGGVKVKGGTATAAFVSGTQPNWAFPLIPIAHYSVSNAEDFEWLMYRPLYMFGNNGNSVAVNYPLSPASAPAYSGKSVSFTMKGWKWSNGEPVSGQDVIFFLNMLEAEKANFAGYSPGTLPDNLTSYKATGDTVTMTTNAPYSAYWFTYNQLAEITPMPESWDVTSLDAAPGSGGCATDSAADHWARCKAVFTFLNAQAADSSAYATSPIWGTVDGPWRMSVFSSGGNDTFVPNKAYSGSPKPSLSAYKIVTYTSDTSEYTALKTSQVDVSPIPAQDLPMKSAGVLPPTNPLGNSNYTLTPSYSFTIFYGWPNLNGPLGPAFRQAYVREALQMGTDQPGIDKAIYRGYAYPTNGAVPAQPPSQWISSDQALNSGQGLYGFNLAKARSLLASHGWSETGGVMTCEDPAKCGAGVPKGMQLKFTAYYVSGIQTVQQQADVIKSDYSKIGIDVNMIGQSFNTILGETAPCKPGPNCTWDFDMGSGWEFNGPGFEPTGEPIFETGAGSNNGNFSNPAEDKLINQTHTNSSLAVFHQYANYTDSQAPVIWQPDEYAIEAVTAKLHNVGFNPLGTTLPEYWYFTK
jgi:peptide/nickel transport system substrate-binding protein